MYPRYNPLVETAVHNSYAHVHEQNILDDIFDNSFPIKNIRYVFNQYQTFIEFPNGSRLKIIVANDSSKGNKTNGCLIDEDISNDIKRMIVYPQLFPRIISIEDLSSFLYNTLYSVFCAEADTEISIVKDKINLNIAVFFDEMICKIKYNK